MNKVLLAIALKFSLATYNVNFHATKCSDYLHFKVLGMLVNGNGLLWKAILHWFVDKGQDESSNEEKSNRIYCEEIEASPLYTCALNITDHWL